MGRAHIEMKWLSQFIYVFSASIKDALLGGPTSV
jgi:hypothetical protein